jgi:L,D-peptidoglycan transpeptidase YkuD (ErfK/YbiS/YcfS/YnhG family)
LTCRRFLDFVTLREPRPRAHRGMLEAGGALYPCAIGRSGLVRRKREGDGGTPVGRWPMRYLVYRADRMARPATGLPAEPMAPWDAWCEAPGARDYNRPVRLPHPYATDSLWREDHLYDLLVVLGHNDEPPVSAMGSAIFFHLAREDYGPTAGCVAVRRPHMLSILSRCGPGTLLVTGGA